MISLLASILFTGSALALPSDSLTMTRDSLSSTTLREVTIRPDSMLPVQRIVEEIIRKEREEQIHVPPLGEFLQKRFPRLNDIITHPTAFRQRRREARTRRCLKNLEEYAKLKTFDDLLREAYERQMLEDSLNAIAHP
jgi:hypothetical protein